MHDHQSDWKSIYSNLDDMDNFDDPLMGTKSTHSLIDSKQLNHAKSVFRQMKQKAFKDLNNINGLKPKDKRIVQIKISDLFTRAEIKLQDVDYRVQITNLIQRTKIQLSRIIIIKKFANQVRLVILKLQHSSLAKSQRAAAISEMRTIEKYTKQDLIRSQTMSSLQDSYVSGKNSINGALVKYVADCQINISDQLKSIADKVHRNIEIQPNLNVAAKYLAYQRIDTIKTHLMADLMSAGNFVDLAKVKAHGLNKLKSILNDKDKVLENLTNFNQFVARIHSMITKFTQLSSGDKLNLEQRIDDYQKKVELQVQQLRHNEPDNDFNFREHYLAIMVINAISDACKHKISNQKMKLTSDQQDSLTNGLQVVISKIQNDFEESHLEDSTESSLINGLKSLQTVASRINYVIYRNQVHQFIKDIQANIKRTYELSTKDKHHLQSRILMVGKHLLHKQTNMTVTDAKKQLYGSFHKQANYMIQTSMHHIFNDLYKQIQASHLSDEHTRQFLDKLTSIRQKAGVDYESKQLLIKNVLHQSLVVDKNENLRRMTKLNEGLHHQVSSFDIASQLDDVLRQDLIDFSQRINDANQLSVADREEQRFESIAYRKLYRLYAGTDSPQASALRTIIIKADLVHRQIDAAVLDSQVNWQINENISKHTNIYLYRLLSIHDSRSLKKYLTKLIIKLKQEIPRASDYLKKVYINQTDSFFKKIDYQLKPYSVSWSIMDKTDLIQSHVVTKIKHANNLLQIEYAKQLGNQQANALVGRVIDHANSHKRLINQKISSLVSSIGDRLVQIKRESKHINLAFFNRVLRIENMARYNINQCLDSDLETNYQRYSRILSQILRQSYLREWLIIVKRAHLMIKNLSNVPTDDKLRALQLIQDLKLKVTLKIQKCDRASLAEVLKRSNNRVRKLITHSIYLDPVKKRARQNLTTLVTRIRKRIQDSFTKKSGKKINNHLNNLVQDIDDQLRLNDDHKVEAIYDTKLKELKSFELKLVRKIQMNRFTKFTSKFGKDLDKMKMLADQEIQQTNEKFNRSYHKTVYEISHASDLTKCKRSEQQGQKLIQRLLDKDQMISDSKQKFYRTIEARIKQAKHQILSLKSLQKKDKHDSNKLMDQIQVQTHQNVKQALSRNQMLDAETKCHKMIKQVIDKVSSASVLVAAIKSANNQISQSTLDKKQKNATLKQINQIIDQGIKSQFNQNKRHERSQDSKSMHQHFNNHNNYGSPHRNDLNDFDVNDTNVKSNKRSGHSSILSSIANAFKNFFRWLRGKLARAL